MKDIFWLIKEALLESVIKIRALEKTVLKYLTKPYVKLEATSTLNLQIQVAISVTEVHLKFSLTRYFSFSYFSKYLRTT